MKLHPLTRPGRRHQVVIAFVCLTVLSLASISAGPMPPVAPTPDATLATGSAAALPAWPSAQNTGFTIDAYGLVTPDQGWVLTGNHLYTTQTGGHSWNDITPPSLGSYQIHAVAFLNAQVGWLALTYDPPDGQTNYALASTTDRGQTWIQNTLPLFGPNDVAAQASTVYLQFLDSQTGYLVVKQATSSNFSQGTLFRTRDGGGTWTRLPLPMGEPVRFVTSEVGWTAGGVDGGELYRTPDGGQTWSPEVPTSVSSPHPLYELPNFSDNQAGVLPVITTSDGQTQVEFHVTSDGGTTWQKAAQVRTNPTTNSAPPVSVIDAEHWVVLDPENQRLTRISAQGAASITPRFLAATHLTDLDMATAETGWALSTISQCSREPEVISGATAQTSGRCVQEVQLLRTDDGGQNWVALPLPPAGAITLSTASPFVITTTPSVSGGGLSAPSIQAIGGHTQSLVGQGFDKCTIPNLAALQDWITHGPYSAVNLYIGGSMRACANTALTAGYLTQLSQQGWTFIPTWVGPQATCSGLRDIMSTDTGTAFSQGVAEANLALSAAASLGLTLADNSGTIIYYDLEAFVGDQICLQAAQSFVSGWTSRLHATGNQAGLYSTAAALSNFVGIANVPDAIWLAAWYKTPPDTYHSDATVWLGTGNPYLSDTLWRNHQRIRQYAGDHTETWGTTSLGIDSDVIDGVVTYVYAPTVSTQLDLPYTNSPFRDFKILVNGYDSRYPIAGYTLQQQMDNGNWVDVGTIITSSTPVAYSIVSPDDNQHSFAFRAQAWDSAGYRSLYPPSGDSNHTVPAACPVTQDGAEPDDSAAQAKPLVLGSSPQAHNFHQQGDTDWITMSLQADTLYILATSNVGGFADTVIDLYGPNNATTFIAESDDAPGSGLASRLVWKPTASGTYYLRVKHFDIYGYGCSTTYTLSAAQARLSYLPLVGGR